MKLFPLISAASASWTRSEPGHTCDPACFFLPWGLVGRVVQVRGLLGQGRVSTHAGALLGKVTSHADARRSRCSDCGASTLPPIQSSNHPPSFPFSRQTLPTAQQVLET